MKLKSVAAILACIFIVLSLWIRKKYNDLPKGTGEIAFSHEKAGAIGSVDFLPSNSDNTASTGTTPDGNYLRDAAWIKEHDAGIVFHQTSNNLAAGRFEFGGLWAGLGGPESEPPFLCHQLRTSEQPVLLGERYNRHRNNRCLMSVELDSGEMRVNYELTISTPRLHSNQGVVSPVDAGFVFRRDAKEIDQIGVIIPTISAPPGCDPASYPWTPEVRLVRRARILSFDYLSQLKHEPIDNRYVILMNANPDMVRTSVRILWLKFGRDGFLEVANQ